MICCYATFLHFYEQYNTGNKISCCRKMKLFTIELYRFSFNTHILHEWVYPKYNFYICNHLKSFGLCRLFLVVNIRI